MEVITVRLPEAVVRGLLKDTRLTHADRSTYAWIVHCFPDSVRDLCRQAGLPRTAAAQSCRRLEEFRWLRVVDGKQRGQSRQLMPLVPVEIQLAMARELEAMYAMAPNRGEFLMRCHLDLLVRSRRFMDNARPELLASPKASGPLEYDRYYDEERVAFEFHGPQHFGVTQQFSDLKALQELQNNDLVKQALSVKAGVRLVVVTAADLGQGDLTRLMPDGLALNPIDREGPYFQTLLRIGKAYAAKSERG
jgi:hypothetical protein